MHEREFNAIKPLLTTNSNEKENKSINSVISQGEQKKKLFPPSDSAECDKMNEFVRTKLVRTRNQCSALKLYDGKLNCMYLHTVCNNFSVAFSPVLSACENINRLKQFLLKKTFRAPDYMCNGNEFFSSG